MVNEGHWWCCGDITDGWCISLSPPPYTMPHVERSKYNPIALLLCYYNTFISSNNWRYCPGTSIGIYMPWGHRTQYRYTGPPDGHSGPHKLSIYIYISINCFRQDPRKSIPWGKLEGNSSQLHCHGYMFWWCYGLKGTYPTLSEHTSSHILSLFCSGAPQEINTSVGHHHNYLQSTLWCSRARDHLFDLTTYTIHLYTVYLLKELRENGPVTVEIACSLSEGGMMNKAGWWERVPDLVSSDDGKRRAQCGRKARHWWEGRYPDADKDAGRDGCPLWQHPKRVDTLTLLKIASLRQLSM